MAQGGTCGGEHEREYDRQGRERVDFPAGRTRKWEDRTCRWGTALGERRRRVPRGTRRTLDGVRTERVGLTLSYVIIVLALIALVVWLLTSNGSESPSSPGSTTATQTTPGAAPPPPPRTTVFTPPPAQRPTVRVEQLRVGDCVEVQQTQPDPTRGPDTNVILIFPVRCEVRDGVFRVDQILSTDSCPVQALFNRQETIFACISNYRG